MKTAIPRNTVLMLMAVVLMCLALPLKAQTILSNEVLVTSTFAVNKTEAKAECHGYDCTNTVPMLTIPVNCPAKSGQTCTFHIAVDAKVLTTFPCNRGCAKPGPQTFYQFLVDGAVPSPGPTDGQGNYIFGNAVYTYGAGSHPFQTRLSYPASVVSTVPSGNHTIVINLGCADRSILGGCKAIAYWSTTRIDVFEP